MHPCRSAKVRKIVQYKRRASALLARYEGSMAQISPVRHRAERLRHLAEELEVTLTPCELSELRRVRRCG